MPGLHDVASGIVSGSLDVLYIDTCSVLDIYRFPARMKIEDWTFHQGVIDALLDEKPRYACVISEQARTEMFRHLDETAASLSKCEKAIVATLKRNQRGFTRPTIPQSIGLSAAFGEICNAVLSRCVILEPTQAARANATHRTLEGRRPARKLGGGVADCLICEQAIELAETARGLGFSKRFIFLSSNVDDYCESGRLAPDIRESFAPYNIDYCRDWSEAAQTLGLK